MKLPDSIRQQFRAHGRRGGLERAQRLSAPRRQAIARQAALRRWMRVRFGVDHFGELALPGAELVDEGLRDLAAGEETIASLLLALGAPRLRREGVPLPASDALDPELRLYRLLEIDQPDLAHARYLALLRQLQSFADSLARVQHA